MLLFFTVVVCVQADASRKIIEVWTEDLSLVLSVNVVRQEVVGKL
jgi:hypothetical protein